MGHKINPISLRLQTHRTIDSSWYSDFHYGELSAYESSMRVYMQAVYSSARLISGRVLSHIFPKQHVIYALSHVPLEFAPKIKISPNKLGGVAGSRLNYRNTTSIQLATGTSILGQKESPGSYCGLLSEFLGNSYDIHARLYLLHWHQAKTKGISSPAFTTKSVGAFMEDRTKTQIGPLLKSDSITINGLQKFYKLSSLKEHMEKYASHRSGLDTHIFGIQTKHLLQSATSVAHMISRNLEQKKTVRQLWTTLLQENKGSIKGLRIVCAGRLGGVEMARIESRKWGQTPLHSFSEKIDYAVHTAQTSFGRIGVKVWICYK